MRTIQETIAHTAPPREPSAHQFYGLKRREELEELLGRPRAPGVVADRHRGDAAVTVELGERLWGSRTGTLGTVALALRLGLEL